MSTLHHHSKGVAIRNSICMDGAGEGGGHGNSMVICTFADATAMQTAQLNKESCIDPITTTAKGPQSSANAEMAPASAEHDINGVSAALVVAV